MAVFPYAKFFRSLPSFAVVYRRISSSVQIFITASDRGSFLRFSTGYPTSGDHNCCDRPCVRSPEGLFRRRMRDVRRGTF